MFSLVIVSLILLLIAGYVTCHNSLVKAALKVDQGWSGITIQLKRRHELVPNLVDAARTAMSHETHFLDKILAARSTALTALAGGSHQDVMEAETALSSALQGFVGYSEDNPEITATESLQLLQKQLEETEDQIAASRRLFNGNVQAYNAKVMSIPWNIVARMKRFKPATMFEVDPTHMAEITKPVKLAELGMGGTAK